VNEINMDAGCGGYTLTVSGLPGGACAGPTHTPTPAATSTPDGTSTAETTPTLTDTATPSEPEPTATPIQACPVQFSDVPEGSTFYPYVRCLACMNVVGGYPDGTFLPGNSITRGQLAKVVSNAASYREVPDAPSFEDVPPDSTFYMYVGRMASRGILGGYACSGPGEPCGERNLPYFREGNNATRGQMAKIVSTALNRRGPDVSQMFEDVPPGSTFYDYIQALAWLGAVQGYPCGGAGEPCGPSNLPYFRPYNNVTRGQAAKIVSATFYPGCSTP
jgi:hypothetical protein